MYIDDLIAIRKDNDFNSLALRVFKNQATNNPVYKEYLELIRFDHSCVHSLEQIPFLPISFFKSHKIQTGHWDAEKLFVSSTTTGTVASKHFIKDISEYHNLCELSFKTSFQTDPAQYIWIGLLPSYLERDDASLVYMVKHFMANSNNQDDYFFYLHDFNTLYEQLIQFKNEGQKVILIGVTFALLDFIEQFNGTFPNLTIIETGGMKGRSEEPLRQEVHKAIQQKLNPGLISSEYGMTEMMSQAYFRDEYFQPSKSMKVLPRDITDPLSLGKYGKTACLNIVDLGNLHTCSFIATEDIGIVEEEGKFQVLGRLDYADVRGCSLMYALT